MKYVFDRHYGRLLEAAGVDIREMLIQAHLPEDLLGRKDILLSKEEYLAMMRSAGDQAQPETAIRVATSDGIETFSPPVFAAYCSSDGKNFIKRFAHYKQLVGPLQYILVDGADRMEIEIRGLEDEDKIPAFWAEVEMVFIVNLIRKATKSQVKPLYITLQHDAKNKALRHYLGCPVSKGEKNILAFQESDLLLPFTSRNDTMWQYIEPELRRRLSEMDVDDTTAARVRSALVELLPAGKSTVDDVASKLFLSRRTLQRKLAEEDTTFQRQLNSTRLLLAQHYLRNSDRPSDDIAFLLGYEDTTSFLRAFAVWKGMTVSEYKKSAIK